MAGIVHSYSFLSWHQMPVGVRQVRAELALTLSKQQRGMCWLRGLELFGSTYWEPVPRSEAEALLTCFLNWR